MKLFSKGRRGDTQPASRGDELDSEVPEPELIALRNGDDDEYTLLLPTSEPKRLQYRLVNDNLKVSSFLEVPPDASHYCIGQVFVIVIFSTVPRIEDSVSYSISVMRIAFDRGSFRILSTFLGVQSA